jgi:hypothetical protein
MTKALRILFMVLCGIVGAWVGYWIGHLAGWSENADWPLRIGGGTGAILLSMAFAVLGVALAGALLTVPSYRRAKRLLRAGTPARATVLEVKETGLRASGWNGVRRQLCCQLEVHPSDGAAFHAQATQFMSVAEESSMQPGAEVGIRYDPAKPSRVAIERPVVAAV